MAMTWTVEGLPDDYDNTKGERAVFGTPISDEVAAISRLLENGTDIEQEPLCKICAGFNFKRIDFLPRVNDSSTSAQLQLGSFRELCLRKCALCILVTRALHKQPNLIDRVQLLDVDVAINLEWGTDSGWVEYRNRPSLPVLKIRVEFPDGHRTCEHNIQLFSEPNSPELFLGRIYPAKRVNLGLVSTWLKCCVDNHHVECNTSFRSDLLHPAAKITFYGIDVRAMCLSVLDADSVYCTLSYVWGPTKQFLTTKSSLPELSQPGGLSRHWDQVPLTIKDAIELVKDLGVQYLWVDAICIVQDDMETKMDSIQQMHLVYGKSYLTIIAGTGDNANHGLPGFRKNTRGQPQAVAFLGPEKFTVGLIPRYQSMFYRAPYSQRAWTYQEICFSARSLVFLNGQVFFQCQQAVWREDYVVEHNNVRYQFQELQGMISHVGPRPWEGMLNSMLQQYKLIMEEYTRREITYQEDALNAYKGLSEFLSTIIPFLRGNYYGFHFSIIDWLILWRSTPSATRRPGFPSWSWAGWTGEARLPNIPNQFMEWAYGHASAQFEYSHNKAFPHMLLCESTTASYRLCLPITGENFLNALHPLLDRLGNVCGLLQIHSLEHFLPLFSQEPEAKLVILSDMLPNQGQFLTGGPFSYDSENSPHGLQPWPASPCTGHEGETWSGDGTTLHFYNVMLVVKKQPVLIVYSESDLKTSTWIYEKAGRGVLRNTALKWALHPPVKERLHIV